MTVIITKTVKYKWYKNALFPCHNIIKFLTSWTCLLTGQMTMTSNFITFHFFLRQSTTVNNSIMFIIIFSFFILFVGVFKIESYLVL